MVSTGRTHIFTKHKILRNFQSHFKNARWKHAISDGLLRSRPVPNPGCFSCSTFIPNQLEVASNHSSLQSLHYWTKGKLNSKLIDLKNLNFEKIIFYLQFCLLFKTERKQGRTSIELRDRHLRGVDSNKNGHDNRRPLRVDHRKTVGGR